MKLVSRFVLVLLAGATWPLAGLAESKPKYQKAVLIAPDSESLPLPPEYRFLSHVKLTLDEQGKLSTAALGLELPEKDFSRFIKDIADSDAGKEKGPVIVVVRPAVAGKTSVRTLLSTVKKLRDVMPTDRDTFICVMVDLSD